MKQSSGFTLVELIVVITTLGVLTAIAAPRFFDVGEYRDLAAYDETVSAVRYAQKLAVATGCEVRVDLSGGGYAIQQHASSCTTGAFTTITGHPVTSATFSDVTLSSVPISFTFDAMGRGSSSVVVTVGSKAFSLIAETGYVDTP